MGPETGIFVMSRRLTPKLSVGDAWPGSSPPEEPGFFFDRNRKSAVAGKDWEQDG